MDKHVLNRFIHLASELSPENLSCDGELSRAETNSKYNKLMREWRNLEKEVGRVVSEDEVWSKVLAGEVTYGN